MINKVVIITWKMEDGGDGEQDGGDDHDHKDDDGGQQDVGIDDDNAEQGGLGGRGCIILAWQLFGPLATQGFAKIEEQKIKTSIWEIWIAKKSEHQTRSWVGDILLSFSEEKTQSSPLKRPLVIFVKGNSQTDSFQCYI